MSSVQEPGVVVVTRTVDASAERVFDAWTDPQRMSAWLFASELGSATVENDLRVGGLFRIEMHVGGETHVQTGEYRHIEPPQRLEFTWNFGVVKDSVVSVDIRGTDVGCEVTITHDLLPEAAREGHEVGWIGCLANLQRYLS